MQCKFEIYEVPLVNKHILIRSDNFQDGDRFWRMPECYIRGSTIKYLRIPDEVIDMVKEEVIQKSKGRGEVRGRGGPRGGRGGRGQCHFIDLTLKSELSFLAFC